MIDRLKKHLSDSGLRYEIIDLSELMENSIVANAKMIAKYASFDRETKKEVRKVLGMLADAIHNNSPFVKLLRSFGENKE